MQVRPSVHQFVRIRMHVNIAEPLACVTASFDGQGLAENQTGSHGELVKMLITLEPDGIFRSNAYLLIFNFRDIGMQNDDEASLSIILVG